MGIFCNKLGHVVIFKYKEKYEKYSQKPPQNCDTMALFTKIYHWVDPVIPQLIIFKSFFLQIYWIG